MPRADVRVPARVISAPQVRMLILGNEFQSLGVRHVRFSVKIKNNVTCLSLLGQTPYGADDKIPCEPGPILNASQRVGST